AIFSLTTCLTRLSVPLKSLADAYSSLSISPTFVMGVEGGIYDWRLCSEGCLTDWYVPYHPLRLDSRTPGICSGPYDDVPRTTCGRNELLMRCRQ
ncbi:hypothetical protein K443DRAFT_63415, partial [Laccaria amethystina LaAM-08-1]